MPWLKDCHLARKYFQKSKEFSPALEGEYFIAVGDGINGVPMFEFAVVAVVIGWRMGRRYGLQPLRRRNFYCGVKSL